MNGINSRRGKVQFSGGKVDSIEKGKNKGGGRNEE
jgi:hypothetical protein